MTSMEAMALNKAVMIYIDKSCSQMVYPEALPIINVFTENDISEAFKGWLDIDLLNDLGQRAGDWVRRYHDVKKADFSEFIYRICSAGGLTWPREDLSLR